jgi:hypothetical protein
MLSYRSTRSLPNFKSQHGIGPWIATYDALRSRPRILIRGVLRWWCIGVLRHHRNCFPAVARCKSKIALRPETLALHHYPRLDSRTACPTKPTVYSVDCSGRPRKRGALRNRNVREVGRTTTSKKHRLRSRLILPIVLYLALSGITLAEPVIILDPYFYRTPVSEVIDGSTKTILGYYDETDGKVTPLPNPPRLSISELHTLAVAYAQSILKQTSPKFIRDRHGVIVAIRIENQDPAFSSVLLTPGFTDRFENLLGKDCLVCVPNRQTVFLFPRLGGNMEQFSIPLRGIYHNSVWPVSTELFEWRGGALHSIRDFESG